MTEERPFPKVDSSLGAGLVRALKDGEGAGPNLDDNVRLARARLRALAEEQTAQRYGFEEEIGRGGMGVVYRVQDNDLRRALAMKVARGRRRGDERGTTGSDPV